MPRERLATIAHVLRRLACAAALALAWLWCLGVLWFAGIDPIGLRYAVVGAYVLGFPLWLLRGADVRHLLGAFLGTALVIGVLWQTRLPSLDRDWAPDMARMPVVTFDGDRVRIENLRACRYRTSGDFDVHWRSLDLDLRDLRSLDFVVERFADWNGAAHTMLSFGFADGSHVVVSVEIRRERGERFDPLAGLFRQYELAYVLGDERDLVQLRTTHRGSRVYLLPLSSPAEHVRDLFVVMLRRAARLGKRPEFYNTLTSTCTSNIVEHLDRIAPGRIPLSPAVWLPGHSGRLVHELGLLEDAGTWAEVEARCRVDEAARAAGDGTGFSRALRARRR